MNVSGAGQSGGLGTFQDTYAVIITKIIIVVVLGFTINCINGMLIHTFRKHQIFYTTPRYILFIHLVINDMIQLTISVILYASRFIFYKINTSVCLILISMAIFTTLNTPVNLAVMSVECYIAICFPLRHAEFSTIKTTYILIAWIWCMSSIGVLPDIFLFIATESGELFWSALPCERDILFRHPVSIKKREVLYTLYLVVVWLVLIYTYIHIFFVAKAAKSSRGEGKKARNTILLHAFQLILCMLTYIYHFILQLLFYLPPRHFLNSIFASYIFVQILPRLVSPLVYGLRDRMFRQKLKRYLIFDHLY